MLKKQNFGVEVEFTGITRETAATVVAQVLNSRASAAERNVYQTRKVVDSKHRTWKIMRDSSICPEIVTRTSSDSDQYRVELVTPVLQYEDIETFQEIIRELRHAGAKANKSCGIHVHVDGANHTANSIKNLMDFMYARQTLINGSLGNEYRDRWCKLLSPALVKAVKAENNLTVDRLEQLWYSDLNSGYRGSIDHSHYNETRYHGLNLHAFFTKGTVEFRLFNSTLHAGKIKAYIQFCLAISAWAIETTNKVVFQSMKGYTPEKKVTIMINMIRNRLGLTGDEFKTCRLHMLELLKKNAGLGQAA